MPSFKNVLSEEDNWKVISYLRSFHKNYTQELSKFDPSKSKLVKLTAKLEKLHRSAFPSAVRNTLNEVAFNAKKIVPKEASANFTIRQKNLFNRMTIVNRAIGFNVNKMSSKVGIDGTKKISEGLEKQETGGAISNRKILSHDMARVSNSSVKKVKAKNYLKKVGKFGKPNQRVKGGKYFRIKNGSKETVFERTSNNKITPIFIIRQTSITRVKSQPFIAPSALKASKQMDSIYKKQSEFQFKKHIK